LPGRIAGTLQIELVYRNAWRTRDQAEKALFAYNDAGTTPAVSRRTSATLARTNTRPPDTLPRPTNPAR